MLFIWLQRQTKESQKVEDRTWANRTNGMALLINSVCVGTYAQIHKHTMVKVRISAENQNGMYVQCLSHLRATETRYTINAIVPGIASAQLCLVRIYHAIIANHRANLIRQVMPVRLRFCWLSPNQISMICKWWAHHHSALNLANSNYFFYRIVFVRVLNRFTVDWLSFSSLQFECIRINANNYMSFNYAFLGNQLPVIRIYAMVVAKKIKRISHFPIRQTCCES